MLILANSLLKYRYKSACVAYSAIFCLALSIHNEAIAQQYDAKTHRYCKEVSGESYRLLETCLKLENDSKDRIESSQRASAVNQIRPGDICNAKDNSARILNSANPNDIHPHFRGESYIGTGTPLKVKQVIESKVFSFQFLRADILLSRAGPGRPKDDVATPNVFLIEKEWKCWRN